MPERTFIDTGFVIALINERGCYHEQAQALAFNQKFAQAGFEALMIA